MGRRRGPLLLLFLCACSTEQILDIRILWRLSLQNAVRSCTHKNYLRISRTAHASQSSLLYTAITISNQISMRHFGCSGVAKYGCTYARGAHVCVRVYVVYLYARAVKFARDNILFDNIYTLCRYKNTKHLVYTLLYTSFCACASSSDADRRMCIVNI